MDFFAVYITVFFFVFLVFPCIFFLVKIVLWCRDEHCKGSASRSNNNNVRRTTIYTITANRQNNNRDDTYPEYFWDISPQSSTAIDMTVKVDKDLPSYEEVMRLERERQAAIESTQTNTSSSTTPAVPNVTAAPVSTTRESSVV